MSSAVLPGAVMSTVCAPMALCKSASAGAASCVLMRCRYDWVLSLDCREQVARPLCSMTRSSSSTTDERGINLSSRGIAGRSVRLQPSERESIAMSRSNCPA